MNRSLPRNSWVIGDTRVLLDSHTFLWAAESPTRLGRRARSILEDQDYIACLSAATVWELPLKWQKGKLDLRGRSPAEYFSSLITRFDGLIELPVRSAHVLEALRLEGLHKDPFDRLLIGVARVEGIPIITTDAMLANYDVEVIWD